MAEICQYCGGRLKKLHPAHEVFCGERPRESFKSTPRAPVLIKTIEDIPAALAAVTSKPPVSKDVSKPTANKPKTDRKAYMRDLMRKKRAAAKANPDG